MTKSWPIAKMAITAVCDNTFPKFWVDANTGDSTESTATRISRISSGPSRSTASKNRTMRSRAALGGVLTGASVDDLGDDPPGDKVCGRGRGFAAIVSLRVLHVVPPPQSLPRP